MKRKVLVIEDTASIREEIALILEFEDFEVRQAENGEVGVAMAREFAPDLILCDVMMPVMDGEGVLRALREDADLATTPFVCLTALAERADMRRMMLAGADDYVTKPFRVEEIIQAVQAGLAKGARAEADSSRKLRALRQRLSSSLSHELRTPLNGIIGPADLLNEVAQELGDKDVSEFSQVILQSAERLRRTVDNFLMYADLELLRREADQAADGTSDENGPVELQPLLGGVAKRKAESVGRYDDLSLSGIECSVRSRADHLEKILGEILDNAFAYSESGSPVEITAKKLEGVVEIEISDHGRGMSDEEVSHLGPFVRFPGPGPATDGMGLGVTVARGLAEAAGGELRIESVPGQGTAVYVSLRRA